MRLIDADRLKSKITGITKPHEFVEEIDKRPTVKAIPIELYEQVKGERDVAVEQLKSLNIELFEKPYRKAIPIKFIEAFKKEFRAVASVKAVIEWLLEKWEDEQARLFEKQITEECVSAERFAEWEKENERP